jgi:hypothetical protein
VIPGRPGITPICVTLPPAFPRDRSPDVPERRCRRESRQFTSCEISRRRRVRSELEMDRESARQSGSVHYRPDQHTREQPGKFLQARSFRIDGGRPHCHQRLAVPPPGGELRNREGGWLRRAGTLGESAELWSRRLDLQLVYRRLSRLFVELQSELILERRAQHRTFHHGRRSVCRRCASDLAKVRCKPGWLPFDGEQGRRRLPQARSIDPSPCSSASCTQPVRSTPRELSYPPPLRVFERSRHGLTLTD